MERRLAEFREARRRAAPGQKAEAAPGWLQRCLRWKTRPASARTPAGPAQEATPAPAPLGNSPSWPPLHSAVPPAPRDQWLLTRITVLKVLLWLVLLGLFVELEFGLAYFVLSLFYWMYVGTRSPEEKKEGERSAYSVFNPGCEPIQGTLTAEQFERELLFRSPEGR
ncbi:SAYSvFN domain-containing protein 1 [Sorex araneus]|uniref:SAYSvFN domain-containing protein 1 n=1 Tax=Sorex araneus TaxID=42254 RepID=UPI00033151A2|nr:SAYSvFN domain-containing protein 1 [Sorex araneus]